MGEEMCLNWSHLLVIISRLAHWLFAVVSVNDSSSMHCVSRLYLGWAYGHTVHMCTCLWADQDPCLVSPRSQLTLVFKAGSPVERGTCCFRYICWRQAFRMVCLPPPSITETTDVHCTLCHLSYMDVGGVASPC